MSGCSSKGSPGRGPRRSGLSPPALLPPCRGLGRARVGLWGGSSSPASRGCRCRVLSGGAGLPAVKLRQCAFLVFSRRPGDVPSDATPSVPVALCGSWGWTRKAGSIPGAGKGRRSRRGRCSALGCSSMAISLETTERRPLSRVWGGGARAAAGRAGDELPPCAGSPFVPHCQGRLGRAGTAQGSARPRHRLHPPQAEPPAASSHFLSLN